MYLKQVITYGGGWEKFKGGDPFPYAEIINIIRSVDIEALRDEVAGAADKVDSFLSTDVLRAFEALWIERLKLSGWKNARRLPIEGVRTQYQNISTGYLRSGVLVKFMLTSNLIDRWLFSIAPLAYKSGKISLPVVVYLDSESEHLVTYGKPTMRPDAFESLKDSLLALAPLKQAMPFTVLAISHIPPASGEPEFIHLDADDETVSPNIVINRVLEIPAAYHQAAIGIFSYFGTVLREKCPLENAVVRIEQEGLKVRLVVESPNGDRDVIERMLADYERVIVGEVSPEVLALNQMQLLELRHELGIAKMRMEAQKDMMIMKDQLILTLRELIQRPVPALSVNVSPVISTSSNANAAVGIQLKPLIDSVNELGGTLASQPDMSARLDEIEEGLQSLRKCDSDGVRSSKTLKKLQEFLNEAQDTGSALNSVLRTAKDGVNLLQGLGRTYNSVAEWCGAPQVPQILLGEKN